MDRCVFAGQPLEIVSRIGCLGQLSHVPFAEQ